MVLESEAKFIDTIANQLDEFYKRVDGNELITVLSLVIRKVFYINDSLLISRQNRKRTTGVKGM